MRRGLITTKKQKFLRPIRFREITITNNESSALSNFQVCIEISDQDFLDKADPNNLVLLDGSTVLPYWVEEWKRPSGKARIWTKLSLNASESKTIQLYYGFDFDNPPSGDNVFEFFDDFDGDSLNTEKWNVISGSWSVSDSLLSQSNTSESHFLLKANYTTQTNEIYELCGETLDRSAHESYLGIAHRLSDINNFYSFYLASIVNFSYSGNRWKKMVSGTWSLVEESSDDYGHDINVFYKLKVKKVGNTYTFYVNEDQKFSESDSSLSTNAFGIWMYTEKAKCDYVFARKYTANEPSVSVGSELVRLADVKGSVVLVKPKSGYFTHYYRQITITNNESSALSNFQVCIEISDQDFLDKADPNNLVLLDGSTVLPYWVEEWKRPSGKARIWTKLSLNASETKYVYLFYGGYVSGGQDGDDVFLFFDDFGGDSLDTGKWSYNNNGSMSVENSLLKLSTGTTSGTNVLVYASSISASLPLIIEARKMVNNWGSNDDRGATVRLADSGDSNSVHCCLFRTNSGDYRVANKVSGSWNSPQAIVTGLDINTFFRLKVEFDGTDVVVRLLRDQHAQIGSHTFSSFSFTPSRVDLQTANASTSTDCRGWFDFIFYRKYTSNEPSVSVGNEVQSLRVW